MVVRTLWLAIACLGLGACPTPCTELNGILVEFYEDCGVPLHPDLEDGGRGGRCDGKWDWNDCIAACYEEAGCSSIDGSDPAAEDARRECVRVCEES